MTDRAPDALRTVYGSADAAETRAFYERWAGAYEADTLGQGFRVPLMAAALVARHVPRGAGPILDAACGSGLVGDALRLLGYPDLVGADLSPAMLALARGRDLYAALDEADLAALPYADDTFAAATCVGALVPGHAPPAAIAELVRVVRPGGTVVLNIRVDGDAGDAFVGAIAALAATGRVAERERTPPFSSYLLGDTPFRAVVFALAVR